MVPQIWKPLGKYTAQETRGYNEQENPMMTSVEGGAVDELRIVYS